MESHCFKTRILLLIEMASWFSCKIPPEKMNEKPTDKEVHIREHSLITDGRTNQKDLKEDRLWSDINILDLRCSG